MKKERAKPTIGAILHNTTVLGFLFVSLFISIPLGIVGWVSGWYILVLPAALSLAFILAGVPIKEGKR